jgi:hypothetical protein
MAQLHGQRSENHKSHEEQHLELPITQSTIVLQELTVAHVFTKSPAVYKTRKFKLRSP